MKLRLIVLIFFFGILACVDKKNNILVQSSSIPLQGTWQLISGTLIEKGDTSITDYTKNVSFIKIINASHFAFLQHDLKKGKDSAAVYSSGGGSYSLVDSLYTEHLEYCSDRVWEGNDFKFTIEVKNDTFIQRGIEIVESAGINRINIEKYKRVN
jgi:hypothetical protein